MAVGEIEGNIALTLKQIEQVQIYAKEIIEMLPPKAVNELLEGYNQDQEALLNEIFRQINNVVNFGATLESEKLDYLDGLERGMDMSLRKLSYNYFKTTCLPNFHQGWRNLDWGNLVQLYPFSSYICQRGSGKCFAKGTKVVMLDGSLKQIEDIVVGDKLMGKDNTERTVLSLHSGIDEMYEVEQKLFKNYIVNSSHDMYFKKWAIRNKRIIYDERIANEVVIEAQELVGKSKTYFDTIFGVGIKGWNLSEKDLHVEPYWLGYWLGNGGKRSANISTIDVEVVNYLSEYANKLGLRVHRQTDTIVYSIVSHKKFKSRVGRNVLLNQMKAYNLINNKHIPDIYLRSSKEQRLELLAGLIDSDGSNPKKKKNSVVFTQKNKNLALQIQNLCWSLGFRCNVSEFTYKSTQTKSGWATITHTHISGDLTQIPCKVERKKNEIEFNEPKSPQRRGLRIKKAGVGEYYGFTCDKDHLFILEDGTIVKNSFEFCDAFPMWRLYSYDKPNYFQRDSIDNKNRRETIIITNESSLGKVHLAKIVDEINTNDVLREKLNPNGKASLGIESIKTETGSVLDTRTLFGSGLRGRHVGAVVADDLISESSLYSKEQRNKAKEIFYGSIMNIVEPHGYLIVSGTPFLLGDLYTDLKNDPKFKVFEYPGIVPYYTEQGKLSYRLLAPDRFTYKHLMELQVSLGSMVFSREILVTPVSDSSSIFPYEILMKSTVGMEQINLVENIESFPFKLNKVICGVDFAISANIGADFTVMSVWGQDSNENFYLLYLYRKQGASHNEQINQIMSIDQRFKCNTIVCEANGFQSILSDLARGRGLKNIEEFTTLAGNKKSLREGWPSLAAMFERGQIKIPYADGETKEKIDNLFSEFNSVSFNPDNSKLESKSEHDDIVSSCFMAINKLRENTTKFRAHLL